jgi:hypothetical protein
VLAIARGLCGMFGTEATRPLIDAIIDVGCGLLAALLPPLLATIGALFGTLNSDIEQCFPAADRGWSKLHRLGTGGVMGGNAAPSFGGALGGIRQHVEGSGMCSTRCTASGHPCQCP